MTAFEITVNGQPLRFRDEGDCGLLYNPGNGCSALVTSQGLLVLCNYVEGTLHESQREIVASILSALQMSVPSELRG